MQNTMLGLKLTGFIDDGLTLRNRTVNGVLVRGSSEDLAAILDNQLVSHADHLVEDDRAGPFKGGDPDLQGMRCRDSSGRGPVPPFGQG